MLPKKNCIVCLSEAAHAVKLTEEIGVSFFIRSSLRRLLNHNQIETFISCQTPTAILFYVHLFFYTVNILKSNYRLSESRRVNVLEKLKEQTTERTIYIYRHKKQ